MPFVQDGEKDYRFTVRWGAETNTDDADGEIVARSDARPARDAIEALLPGFVSDLMDRCGIVRALPTAFADFSAEALAREMRAPENQPMRRATIRDVSDADIDTIAATMMALPRTL